VNAGAPQVLLCTNAGVLGGAEQMMLALALKLPDLGWEATVAVHANEEFAGAAARSGVLLTHSPHFHDVWGGARLLRPWLSFMRRMRPDVVHIHLPWPFATRAPIMAALALRLPVVLSVHGFPAFEASRRDLAIWRKLVDRVAACLPVSEDMASRLVGHLGWNPERIRVVYPGIDADRFAAGRADIELRRRLLGTGRETLVLYVGRLDHLKGVEILLAALERLPGHALAVVGEGPERATLERHARVLGDHVTFLGGRFDVEIIMASADLLVLPSRTEGVPIVVLEAMAAGLPVVATRVGGIPEAVADVETGLLVPPGDAGALAQAIERMTHDLPLRSAVVAAARRTVAARFTVENMVREVAGAYDVARRRRTRPRASWTAARSTSVEPNDE
jgi:glycosyltransferase involved in cell wall biosynthesis